MIIKWFITTLVIAGSAFPKQAIPDLDPQTSPAIGQAKAEDETIKVQSYDGRWIVRNFCIIDKNGEIAFQWDDKASGHVYIWISWSPDSQRVVLVDQHRGPELFAAQLVNGRWVDVADARIPLQGGRQPSGPSRVDHHELLNWISPTSLRVKDSFLVDDPNHQVHWEDIVESLQFNGNTLRFVD